MAIGSTDRTIRATGHRFNRNKVVLDPYASAIGRFTRWSDELFGYQVGEDDLSFDPRDSARDAPLGVVVDSAFTWGDDAPPRIPGTRRSFTRCTSRASP